MGRAAQRPRGQARRQELPRPSRAADPLDRGLRRPRLEGEPDARALERREPPDRALLRDEDRPDLVLQDELGGRSTVRLARARLEVPGPVGANRFGLPSGLRERPEHRTERQRATSLNDAVDWRQDLGGGTTVGLVRAGTFRSDAGALFGPVPRLLWDRWVVDEIDNENRLLQALNCLLIETPAGRVLVETGIGTRLDEKTRAMRGSEGPWIVPALTEAGFDPASIDVVAMSHLHFDHAGGLLAADGSRAFPNARIVAQRAEWEIALGSNRRLEASYVQPELRLVRDWGAEGWADGERELLPGVSVVPTGGHSAGHQAIVVRGSGAGAKTLAFFGDLCMRPWAANPRWVTAFDDFPLDSVLRKKDLFAQAADEDWIVVLSHEREHPVGRLVRDRDRFRYEPA